MADREFDSTMARLMTIGSVGSEMVIPIGAGIGVDWWLGTIPLFSVVGAVLGLGLGIFHLVVLNRPKSP